MLNIRFRDKTNAWPGFVDLFSNLVIILIFLLIVFVFLWTTTSVFNKRTGMKTVTELKQINAEQLTQIQQMMANEQEAKRLLIQARSELENLETSNAELYDELNQMDLSVEDLVTAYEAKVNDLTTELNQAKLDKERATQLEQERRALQQEMQEMSARIAEQNATDRAQWDAEMAKLQSALDAAEEKSRNQEVQYVEMSTRLNKALADKVAELNSVQAYQSDFYKSVKTALGNRTTVQPDGDRFIVSSDILFPSGSYTLSPEGKNQLRLLANVIKDFEAKIPSDVNWIIRVDGHTDKTPVVPGTRAYRNNTELSLRRATAVVDALAAAGVSRRRLVPSGFGDMHPVELGSSAEALQKNRRIELQLTNR
ncbi:OmpA family protein [bacterium]|nr:OmpA family protein [bacterium]